MIQQEWVVLFRYVRAMFPQQRFDEYTADAWYDVLGKYDPYALKTAIAAHAAKKPFISPAEIIAAVSDASVERVGEFVYEPADPDETPEQYLANLRRQLAQVAAGERPPVLALPPGRPVEDLDSIGQVIPPEHVAVRRPGPLGVDCPNCKAPLGRPCKTAFSGRPRETAHQARRNAALAA
jgi:hypothetical protein